MAAGTPARHAVLRPAHGRKAKGKFIAMIPVEFLWLTLFLFFGVIGAVRGLSKELGSSAILLLSLAALKFGWKYLVEPNADALPGTLPIETVEALYYSIVILFVTFISYEGIVLKFPMKQQKGLVKTILGFPGGLLNGYFIVGTIWDVVSKAKYFGLGIPMGSSGQTIQIGNTLTELHNSIVQYLPVTFINEFVLLALGMILLLAIVLK
jgi:hypothetical protein